MWITQSAGAEAWEQIGGVEGMWCRLAPGGASYAYLPLNLHMQRALNA